MIVKTVTRLLAETGLIWLYIILGLGMLFAMVLALHVLVIGGVTAFHVFHAVLK